jgi:hypothetical protein
VADIPQGFPAKLSDDELADSIEEWFAEYRHRYSTTTLPELLLGFVNAASQEQLRRQVAAAARSADEASKWAGVARGDCSADRFGTVTRGGALEVEARSARVRLSTGTTHFF